MKKVVLSLFALMALSSTGAFANEEVTNLQDIQEAFVVEPIMEAQRLSCPAETYPIARFCWSELKGCLVKCGHVCHPKREIPPPTPEPTNNY